MKTPRRTGSRALGAAILSGALALALVACVVMPPNSPADPQIPGQINPVFTNLTDPPTTQGPTDPPVPTTEPGRFSYGDTVVIHTEMGSTWEITPHRSIDPADDIMRNAGYPPTNGQRYVILELTITNVGVIETHPYFDMRFGYQPDHGPFTAQNSASQAGAPDDIGYTWSMRPGDTVTGQVVVAVGANTQTGEWVLTGDGRDTEYRFR